MKKAFIITVSILSSIILVLGILLYNTSSSLTTTSMNLENLYQRSFYELVNNVNNMEVEVSKLMVTNDSTSQQKSLSKLKQQTSDAESSLSLLPINSNVLEKTTRFMNQLNGYCTSLITYNDGKISGEDFETLAQVHTSINTIKDELNDVMDKIMSGYRISENLDNGNSDADFSLSFEGLSNDTIEYPTLIYDGPFSDATLNKNIRGLSSEEIDENEAESMITKIFADKITNLNYLGQTNGLFETYDFGVNTEDGRNYFIQITKRGKFLLTMSSNVLNDASDDVSDEVVTDDVGKGFEKTDGAEKSDEATSANDVVLAETVDNPTREMKNAIKVSEAFSESLGLSDMKCVWSAASEDICYINLAPVIDDITMYPDLVKVKVDLRTNTVVGWEASAYAYNHTTRDDLIPQLDENEAKRLISTNLQITDQKLCVIPLDYVGETLAYEFSGTYNDYHYYVYIDADSGKQVRVLRIVQTSEGELVL